MRSELGGALPQAVAAEMGSRTTDQCLHHYKDNLVSFKKGDWSPEEDAVLLQVRAQSTGLNHAVMTGQGARRWLSAGTLASRHPDTCCAAHPVPAGALVSRGFEWRQR